MNCAICKSEEFNADYRVGMKSVRLSCVVCGWPTWIKGPRAEVLCKGMSGLECRENEPVINDEITKLVKKYMKLSSEDETCEFALAELYFLINADEPITLDWLRKRYVTVNRRNVCGKIREKEDVDKMKEGKLKRLEVIKSLALVL